MLLKVRSNDFLAFPKVCPRKNVDRVLFDKYEDEWVEFLQNETFPPPQDEHGSEGFADKEENHDGGFFSGLHEGWEPGGKGPQNGTGGNSASSDGEQDPEQ